GTLTTRDLRCIGRLREPTGQPRLTGPRRRVIDELKEGPLPKDIQVRRVQVRRVGEALAAALELMPRLAEAPEPTLIHLDADSLALLLEEDAVVPGGERCEHEPEAPRGPPVAARELPEHDERRDDGG